MIVPFPLLKYQTLQCVFGMHGAPFHVSVGHPYVLFGEISIQEGLSILNTPSKCSLEMGWR